MIVITGTQRSGTSFMASFFQKCGFDLGTTFWDDRIDGGLENPDVCNFYRDFTGTNTFPFTKFWEFIERDYFYSFHNLHKRQQIVKFSYLLMHPAFVDAWYQARGNQDKFVVMTRDLKKVIASKEMRSDIFGSEDWIGLNQSHDELGYKRTTSLHLMQDKYKMEYLEIPFPCGDEWIVKDLQQFTKLQFPKNVVNIWNKLYNPTKIHFK